MWKINIIVVFNSINFWGIFLTIANSLIPLLTQSYIHHPTWCQIGFGIKAVSQLQSVTTTAVALGERTGSFSGTFNKSNTSSSCYSVLQVKQEQRMGWGEDTRSLIWNQKLNLDVRKANVPVDDLCWGLAIVLIQTLELKLIHYKERMYSV